MRRVRRLFPPHGPRYELFDSSVLLLVLGLVGYVLTDPPPNTERTLLVLRFITETQLGIVLVAAAVFGLVCSYTTRWLRYGYTATIAATGALSLYFLVGFVANQTSIRSFISVVLYAWIARRLIRDNTETA